MLKNHIDVSFIVYETAEKKDVKGYGVKKHKILLVGLFRLVKLLTSANKTHIFSIFPCHI